MRVRIVSRRGSVATRRSALMEPLSGWSLVGREEEVALCERCLVGDQWCGVVVAGAPGVGKTRLVMETLATAERLGRVTARVTATETARAIPLGSVGQLCAAGMASGANRF